MSLKRKASFSAMPGSSSAPATDVWDMVDNSKHLHSRTRKRFRDGRPNDEVVYAKTLRWIFSAQQQPQNHSSIDSTNDVMDAESTVSTSEAIDPRQQTLLRFFQPRAQATPFRPSREALAPRANETALDQDDLLRRRAFGVSAGSSSETETASSDCNQMDVDMDMDMDQGSDGSNSTPNMGVVGWM